MDNMIYIKIDNDTFYDDAIVLVRSFYPRMEVKAYKQDTVVTEDDKVIDITVPDMTGLNKSEMHDKFKSYLYDRLSQMTGKTLPWGYLTGVRPSKIAYVMLEDGEDEQTIKKHFVNKHKASEKKASLAINVAKKEMDILNKIDYKNGYSLYIGIPFCPSICLYCSFSSYALDAYKNYVDDYLDALIKEMTFVARAMKGRRLDTVYFGGGTPTTLGAAQLDRLITALKELFDIDGCHEFTVEAGRPDSITRDKLKVLKAHNVGRISIVYLGREVYFRSEILDDLDKLDEKTMCGTDTILIEFSSGVEQDKVRGAVLDVIMAGYHPIVAHVERYVCTVKDWDYIYELKRMGADIQINADSVTGDNGWAVQRCTKALLKDHIVDYIASDAHDLKSRTPQLSKCYKYVVKKYGVEYADKIMKADVTKKFG